MEKGHTRGAYCTSVDACMIGKNKEGKNILFFIEWKYTECYNKKGIKQCDTRKNVYNNRIIDVNSPFKDKRPEIYYYEPFYQLMRQTLLAEECIKHNEYNCTDYKNIHVIPKENGELLKAITSNKMTGANMSEAWESVLERPESYICLSPKEFLSPLFKVV